MRLLAVDTLVPAKPPKKTYKVGLLAHFVQKLFQLLQVMCELPNDWENYKERQDAPEPYSGS